MKQKILKSLTCLTFLLSFVIFMAGCAQDVRITTVDPSLDYSSSEQEISAVGDVPVYIGKTVDEVRAILGSEDDLYNLHGAAALQFNDSGTVVGIENVLAEEVTGTELVTYQEEWNEYDLGNNYSTKMTMDQVSERISEDQDIDPVIEEDLAWSGYYTETPVFLDNYKIVYYWESDQSGELSSHIEISQNDSFRTEQKDEDNNLDNKDNKENSGNTKTIEKNSTEEGWESFISNAEYGQYIDKEDEFPDYSYAIYDLDGDGHTELLLEANQEASAFCYTWIFQKTDDGIEVIALDHEEYGNCGYGSYRFLPEKMEIVGNCGVRPNLSAGWVPFYKLKNGKLEYLYEVGNNEGQPYYFENGGSNRNISEQERDSFYEGIIDFDWTEIR